MRHRIGWNLQFFAEGESSDTKGSENINEPLDKGDNDKIDDMTEGEAKAALKELTVAVREQTEANKALKDEISKVKAQNFAKGLVASEQERTAEVVIAEMFGLKKA